MKTLLTTTTALLTFTFCSLTFAEPTSQFDQANEYYDNGDCENAVSLYGNILEASRNNPAVHDVALFRRSYCELTLNQPQQAARGFEALIQGHHGNPDFDEARLKLTESYCGEENFHKALETAAEILSTDSRMEAFFLVIQSLIESNQPEEAIRYLNKYDHPRSNWVSVYQYWYGVSLYTIGDKKAALTHFQEAHASSTDDIWVKKASQEWITQIENSLRLFKGQVTLGYLYDSNVGQSGTQYVSTYGVPEAPKPANSDTFIKDTALWTALELGLQFFNDHPWSTTLNVDFSSPYYQRNQGYNNQNISSELLINNRSSINTNTSLSLKYTDSRYNNLYYQDYAIGTFGFSWLTSKSTSLKFDVPVTQYVRTRHTFQYGTQITGKLGLSSTLALYANVTLTKSKGQNATYYNTNPTYLLTGNQFASYTSYGSYLALSYYMSDVYSLSLFASMYQTNYEKEQVPTTATKGIDLGARQDTLTLYSLSISRTMIPDVWTLGLRYDLSHNKSSGFQGLPTYITMYNYNYDRNYVLLTNTVSF